MEKYIAVILSFVMALAIVGCSGNADAPAPTTHEGDTSYTADGTVIPGSDPKTWGPAEDGENIQIPNPWQECTSLEEAGKLAGFSFTAPQTVDGYTERYIAVIENEIAIQRGLRMVYHHREIDRALFEKYRRRFSPYCSVASLYLWAVSGGAIPEMKDYKSKSK